jgi:hypothetical protein
MTGPSQVQILGTICVCGQVLSERTDPLPQLSDVAVNVIGDSGGDIVFEHNRPGQTYLRINSECDWTVRAYDNT